MERNEDLRDREQAVWEALTEKVTFKQRPKEEEGGSWHRVLEAELLGRGTSWQRPQGKSVWRTGRRPVLLQWSKPGKVGRWVRRDNGGLAGHLEDFGFYLG